MKRRIALLAGGIAVGAAAVWRTVRRRPPGWVEIEQDPRADALRQRLDESRVVAEDRDEFESAETTVDTAEALPADPAERRQAVHAEGRSVVDRMRGANEED